MATLSRVWTAKLSLGLDDHLQNRVAEQWITSQANTFATCPLTQLGFLRIAKQLRRDISIHQIGAVLESICRDPRPATRDMSSSGLTWMYAAPIGA